MCKRVRVVGTMRDIDQLSERRTHVACPHTNVTPTKVSGAVVRPA
jgi:hypothetical protein